MKRTATITAIAAATAVVGYLALAPVPEAPNTITFAWNDTNSGVVTFNIYGGTEPRLASFRLLTNTSDRRITLPADKAAEFFSVKAVRSGLESGWATR